MRGIFLDIDTVDRGDIVLDTLRATLPEWTFLASGTGNIGELVRDADIVVSNKVLLDKPTLGLAKKLKLVCVAATGTNNVDLAAAAQRQIVVCNVRNYATASVVEHVLGLILCLNRNLPQYLQAVAQGEWQKSAIFCMLDYPIRELAGQTIGIIGYGELGCAVAAMADHLGMQVLVAERRGAPVRPGRTPFEDVLSRADIISLHCPLTDDTRHLIGQAEFTRMRRNAILINTARGEIVNENELLTALQSGRIGGAAIDVLETEPPSSGNPLLSLSLPNLMVTPHIAWASRDARQRLVDEIALNIQAFLAGSPRNVVQQE
jgi:glycerate dehydrogenase